VNIKTVLKTSVAAAALVAISAPAVVSQAEAGINNGNKNSLVMSGQIVRALFYQDNGNDSQLFQGDGRNTKSRVRWIVSGQMTESVAIGGLVEMNFPNSNSGGALNTNSTSTTTSVNNGEVQTDSGWQIRHSRVDFKHKSLGTLSIGQSSIAGDGAATQSFMPGAPFHGTTGAAVMGNSHFAVSNNGITAAGAGVGSAASGNFDPGREDRVRYDTPSFGGLKLAVSHQDNGQSVAVNYGGKFGGVQVAAAAFYENTAAGSTTVDASLGGSAGIKHDSGLSAQISYSREDVSTGTLIEGRNISGGIGYEANLTNLGSTGFAFTYSTTDESVANNDEGETFHVSVNQNVDSVGADLYAGFARSSYEGGVAGVNYDDFTTIYAGTRLNF